MLKIEKKFVLFVSPFEASTSKWEINQFSSLEEMDKFIYDRDLTKDYFGLSVKDLRKYCKNIFHPKKQEDRRYLIFNENECFVSTEYPKNATSIVAMSEISQILSPHFEK